MKVISHKLGESVEYANIYCLSDIHIGSPKCKLTKLREVIETIKNDDNGYCVLLGDLINNTTKNSVGDVYGEELSPMEQVKLCISLFECIKDKILLITAGNHEGRSMKEDGIDLVYFFCRELGIQDRYDYASCVGVIRLGHNTHKNSNRTNRGFCYTMYCTHGSGGGRTAGAKANAISRASEVCNTDITIIGHQHMPMTYFDSHYEVDSHNDTVFLRNTVKIMCGAFLDYETYAETHSMKPNAIAVPILTLSGKKIKKMVCRIEEI